MKKTKRLVKNNHYECIYIRYPNSDPAFIKLLKVLKKNGSKIVVEIPTYPYDLEKAKSLRAKVIRFLDTRYRKKIHNYVSRLVTYSDDENIFGIKTINTVNGYDFSKTDICNADYNKSEIHLCAVATLYGLHGYDRLIEGMHNYYLNGGSRKVIFDVVGYGDSGILESYKDLVKKYKLSNNVIFYGKLLGEKLEEVYKKATLGVNSLAIHREGLKKESTLKTREYAAKGLPILSSSLVDAFSDEDNKMFVCLVSADDSPINIENIISFCDNIYGNNDVNSLRIDIRKKSQKICDMPVTLKGVVNFFNDKGV